MLRYTERFDHAELAPEELRVEPRELDASVGVLEPDVLRGLRTAIANVARWRGAAPRPGPVELPEGQRGGGGRAAGAAGGRLRARRAGPPTPRPW